MRILFRILWMEYLSDLVIFTYAYINTLDS